MISNRIITILKFLVTFTCLAVLYQQVDWKNLLQLFLSLQWGWIFLALVIFWASQLVSALRYFYIARTLGGSLDFSTAARAHFIGLWFNQVLPTSLGGDVVKMSLLQKMLGLGLAIRTGILDRLSGLVFVMAAILLTLPFYLQLLPQTEIVVGLGLLAGGFVVSLVLMVALRDFLAKPFQRYPILLRPFQLLDDVSCFTHGKDLWEQTWTSAVVHFNGIAAYALLGLALGVQAGPGIYILIVPLVFLIALMPLSLAGWGVREVGAIWLFGLVGIDRETALAMSVCFGILLMLSGLPGIVLFLLKPSTKE